MSKALVQGFGVHSVAMRDVDDSKEHTKITLLGVRKEGIGDKFWHDTIR